MQSLREVIEETEQVLGILSGGTPNTYPIGLPKIDDTVGGLSPSTVGLLGADTGVGKTQLTIMMAMNRMDRGHKSAIISTEDPADVIGARILAYKSGINAQRMRLGKINHHERLRLAEIAEHLDQQDEIICAFPGSRLSKVLEATDQACKEGCKIVYLDYIQDVTGHNRANTYAELNETMVRFKDILAEHGAAGMIASQMTKPNPQYRTYYTRHDIRGSRDIANKARLILIAEKDSTDPNLVYVKVDKSTHGGEGMRQSFVRNGSGLLIPIEKAI